MKKIIGTIVGFYIINFWIVPFLYPVIFPSWSVDDNLYPIYTGIILLSGLFVGCTMFILEELKELKDIKKDSNLQ